MRYMKAHAPLIRSELVEEHGKYRQANFISQQAPTPVFIEKNSSNSARQKLHRLALQLSASCYQQNKSSYEIVREFLLGIERLRSML